MKWQDLAAQLHRPIPHPTLTTEEMCQHLPRPVSSVKSWRRTLFEIRRLPEVKR